MTRILVAEPSVPISAALRKFLQGVAEVHVAHYLDEAVQLTRARPPDVVMAAVSGTFDGEALCAQVRKLAPATAVVLVYPAEDERAAERAQSQGADSFLVVPLKKPAVLAMLQAVLKVRGLKERIAALERAASITVSKPVAATGFNTGDEAFFKKFLLLEIKRSRRYQYPVALLMVSLRVKQPVTQAQRAILSGEALTALGACIREVDLAVVFGGDKYLLFLPHTTREGARQVAERLVKQLGTLPAFKEGVVSVGVACHDPKLAPKAAVSYGALVREASNAVKRAIAAGGNCIDITPTVTPPKRNRISMG